MAHRILELHYRPNGVKRSDRTSVGIYFSSRPATRFVAQIAVATNKIKIPPNESHHAVSFERVLTSPAEVISLRPHMHQLGVEAVASATFPTGETRELLRIANWDYQWQPFYVFSKPVKLPTGTKLQITCIYDNSTANPLNSSPPKRVGFGWGRNQEMCNFQSELSFDSRADLVSWVNVLKQAAAGR